MNRGLTDMQSFRARLTAITACCALIAPAAISDPQQEQAEAQWRQYAQRYNAYTVMSLANERCGFLSTEEYAFAKARAGDMARDLSRANVMNTSGHHQQAYDQIRAHANPCGELVPGYLTSPALMDLRRDVQTYLLAWSIAGLPADCSEWITKEHTYAVMARGEALAEKLGADPKEVPPIAALGEEIRLDCANGAITGASAAGALAAGHLLQAQSNALGYNNAALLGAGIAGLRGEGELDGLPWAAVAWERQEEFDRGMRDQAAGLGDSEFRVGFLQDGQFALWQKLTGGTAHEPRGPLSRVFTSSDWSRAAEMEGGPLERVFILSTDKSEFLRETRDYDNLNFRLVRENKTIEAPAELYLRQLQAGYEFSTAPGAGGD